MRISNNVYNHLSANLVPKKRNTTHKSSELKEIYSRMAKYNKSSPLFLFSVSDDKVSRMIDIKEAAITLKDAADIFSDSENPIYKKKLFYSEDSDYISGSLRGSDLSGIPDELTVSVKSLANGQVNTGKYLNNNDLNISSGRYSFTIDVAGKNHEISFSVNESDTNRDVQKRIVDTINKNDIGIKASIVDDGESSAIMFASNDTGVTDAEDGLIFSLAKDESSIMMDDIFGLDNVSVNPKNSIFTINGEEHSSTSNNISINQILELDFHKASDKEIKIGLLPDTSDLKEQLGAFVEAYNSLVDLGIKGESGIGSSNLLHDISGLVKKHRNELSHAGITISDTGHLVHGDVNTQNINSSSFSELFSKMSSFKEDVESTAEKLSFDPMAYISKLIVTYPNTGNKFGASYTQSLYSGLMYNNYA